MRIEVELHPTVVWFVSRSCRTEDREAFYRELEKVRSEPIANSEALHEPRLSRYMLRKFRFGGNIAVFQFDAAKNRMRIVECRSQTPRRRGKRNRPGNGLG